MGTSTPISLAARERLRDHQAAGSKAVAAHAAAVARLDAVSARRARILAIHDAAVAAATTEVRAAVLEVVRLLGADVAAAVLNLPVRDLRAKRAPRDRQIGDPAGA
jgi:hypothetical protein